ncbi:hypothetical protein ARMGADRAFT_1083318 [Armillaria gallica]|uniref:Uncharacterized protein n=1 Tax=Armillaria gallica TaxID=47427 RepID=A0A2H3DEI9_ARMGA|nr:hypothetical protein ARMGADRAFT_1083318 [Armillaria gallica]
MLFTKLETINQLLNKHNCRVVNTNGTTTGTGTPSTVKVQNNSDEEAMEVEGIDLSPGAEEKIDVDDIPSSSIQHL